MSKINRLDRNATIKPNEVVTQVPLWAEARRRELDSGKLRRPSVRRRLNAAIARAPQIYNIAASQLGIPRIEHVDAPAITRRRMGVKVSDGLR